MESRNPVIRRAEEQYAQEGPGFASINVPGAQQQATQPGQQPPNFPPPASANTMAAGAAAASADQLKDMYNQPSVAGADGPAMTMSDVIVKTGINFAVLVPFAVIGWATAESIPWLWMLAMFAGLGLGLVNSFKKQVSPVLVLAYAAVEGLFLGGISKWYQAFGEANGYGNLVATAVVATFVVFAVMLFLYQRQIIKVNQKFMKIFMVALISYLAFSVISVIAGLFFHVGQTGGATFGFFGAGWMGIAFSAIAVILASFSLVVDFEAINQGIQYGVPERESWRMAFGLLVTLIWLYLELLRLLALIAANSRN